MIELACDVRDFSAQSTAAFSEATENLDGRMMSFLSLLDKRKDKIFSPLFKEPPTPAHDPSRLVQEVKDTLDEYELEINETQARLNNLVAKIDKREKSSFKFLHSLFGKKEPKVTPSKLRAQIDNQKHKCFLEVVRLLKRYPLITVYLEFESIAEIREGLRHYAILSEKDQIGRLPMLLTMHETPGAFEIDAIRDVFKADQWKSAE